MTEHQAGANAPFEEEYLESFNRIPLRDVPPDTLDRYFRSRADVLRMPDDDPFFVVYSRIVVLRALCSGYEPVLLIMRNCSDYMDVTEAVKAACPDLPVCLIDGDQMSVSPDDPDGKAYSFSRFGISALFRKKPLLSIPDMLQSSKKVVVFRGYDNTLEDLYDLGPKVRSATAFFADAVIYQAGAVDPYDRVLARAAAGNNFLVPFTVYEDDRTLIRTLAEQNFTTVLAATGDAKGAVPLNEADCIGSKLAVVIDLGIQNGKADDPAFPCDLRVYVPGSSISGMDPSAASVILYGLFTE